MVISGGNNPANVVFSPAITMAGSEFPVILIFERKETLSKI